MKWWKLCGGAGVVKIVWWKWCCEDGVAKSFGGDPVVAIAWWKMYGGYFVMEIV